MGDKRIAQKGATMYATRKDSCPPRTKLTKTVETRHLERRKANSQRTFLTDPIAQQSNAL